MNIYFAVSDEMLKQQHISKINPKKPVKYILSGGTSEYGETFLAYNINTSAGKLIDGIEDYVNRPYTICRAKIKEKDLVRGLCAAMIGDVVWTVDVMIDDLKRVK